jgi:hypothetical protein
MRASDQAPSNVNLVIARRISQARALGQVKYSDTPFEAIGSLTAKIQVSARATYDFRGCSLGSRNTTPEDIPMRALLLALATAGALATGAPALAQTFTVNPNLTIDVTGFNGDANTLPDMVANIEAQGGGRVAVIAFNNFAGNTPGYGFIQVQGTNYTFKRIEKPTGKPIQMYESALPAWMLNWRNEKRAAVVETAKVPLADAIRTAVASEGGSPAVVAGIARSAANSTTDVHAYMIGILKNGSLRRVAVDSQTGAVIENPETLTM